jgi:hypothetical protein
MVKKEELWLTNTCLTKDITVGDLGIVVRKGQSINLLSKKQNGQPKYMFNKKQIDDSISTGSISKNKLLKIRIVAPVIFNHRIDIIDDTTTNINSKTKRKQIEVEIPEFPDLDFEDGTDEEFAAENADIDFADKKPMLSIDPKFDDNSFVNIEKTKK